MYIFCLCLQEAQRRAKAERAAGAGKPPHKPGGESSYPSKEQKTLGGKPQGSKPGPQVMVGSEDPQQQQQQKTLAKMTKSKSLVCARSIGWKWYQFCLLWSS